MILQLIGASILMLLGFGSSLLAKVNQNQRKPFVCRLLLSSLRSVDVPNSSAIEDTVAQYLSRHCRIPVNSFVLLSVSGGLDSMAMLHLLCAVSRTHLPLHLEVISFNHKLRPESDEEISFVSSWAETYGLKFHERILPESQRSLVGLQATAREWRRKECFQVISDRRSADFACHDTSRDKMLLSTTTVKENLETGTGIQDDVDCSQGEAAFATAHHADDQQETILLKFLRGTHISHLQPMLPRSEDGRVIHPLLGVTKAQLEAYMREGNFEWREDSSNQLRKYKRNVVRLDLLPVMDQLAGGTVPLKKRFEALAEQSAELQQWLDLEADKFFSLSLPLLPPQQRRKDVLEQQSVSKRQASEVSIELGFGAPFLSLPSPLVQREVLQRTYRYLSNGKPLSYETTCNLLSLINEDMDFGKREKSMQLDKELLAVRIGNFLLFRIAESSADVNTISDVPDNGIMSDSASDEQQVSFRGVTVTADKIFDIAVKEVHPDSVYPSIATEGNRSVVSLGAGGFSGRDGAPCASVSIPLHHIPPNSNIRIRFPMDGDRFQPDWRRGPVRVVEFLRGQKVPLHTRSSVPIVLLSQPRVADNEGAADEIISIPPFIAKKHWAESLSVEGSVSLEITLRIRN